MSFQLSDDQQSALRIIERWLSTDEQRLTLGGYAGTGKTTLVSQVLGGLQGVPVAVCAYTGKAVEVLRRKGVPQPKTLHRLLYIAYSACAECKGTFPCDDHPRASAKSRFRRVPFLKEKLVIVDEASMINVRLVEDLESFETKVLYIGDHGQLEPIGENPGLMREPDIRLEQIHRQAQDSAIIRFAHAVRKGEPPQRWSGYARHDLRIVSGGIERPQDYEIVLCGYNKTRIALNRRIRDARGFHFDLPLPGEWVICLRNNYDFGIFNGQRFQVERCTESKGEVELDLVDEVGTRFPSIPVDAGQFGQERTAEYTPEGKCAFDWGYALTVHKSQGSEYGKVAVVEEVARSWSPHRWRYTAITRASQELHYYT